MNAYKNKIKQLQKTATEIKKKVTHRIFMFDLDYEHYKLVPTFPHSIIGKKEKDIMIPDNATIIIDDIYLMPKEMQQEHLERRVLENGKENKRQNDFSNFTID